MFSKQLVKIALYFKDIKSINVSIKRTVKIGKLSGLSPFPNPIFIHSGTVLQPSTSFEFNNIRNGDTIIACPSTKTKTFKQQDAIGWKKLTETIDFLSRRQTQDEITRSELLRLKDLELTKLELTPKNIIKLTKHQLEQPNETQPKCNTNYVPAQSPSTTALPKIW